MSNLGNYSPYNKTYKFLLYQNQAYHQKNKRNAKPCVRTNLRYKNKSAQQYNPENSSFLFRSSGGLQRPMTTSTNRHQPYKTSGARSMLFSNENKRSSSPEIDKPKRIIHKHQSFQKFSKKRVMQENNKLVHRLIQTNCEIIKNDKSLKSFRNHLKYREIRNKYDSQGKRKQNLALGNLSLLCPTLKGYNESGLGTKFLELDMSMVSQNSSPVSIKKKQSNLSCQT